MTAHPDTKVTVPVYVMCREDWPWDWPPHPVERGPNPSRRSDEETARRVVAREARLREYRPWWVVRP